MWIINQNALARLSKISIENYTKIKAYRTCFTRSIDSNRVGLKRTNQLSYAVFCQIHKIQKRFKEGSTNQETAENLNDNYGEERYSSPSHQRYNRDRYERKRSRSQNSDRFENDEPRQKLKDSFNFIINHYQRLNVDPNANIDSIKSAYYSMSKLYHPDVVGEDNEQAAENFRLITESYDILSNPEARASYDRQLAYESGQLSTANPIHSKNPNTNFNPTYRTRDADMIFRSKLEAAIQREKLKNPRKFRAGSFKSESAFEGSDIQLDRLDKRLHELSRTRSSGGDASDFYRMHLYDTLYRKRTDLLAYKDFGRNKHDSDTDDLAGLLIAGGIFVIVSVVIINVFVDIDLAGAMDDKLKLVLEMRRNEKED